MHGGACRCGVRLYREQKRAQGAEEDIIAKEDDKDDSSTSTFTISNDSSRENSPPRSPVSCFLTLSGSLKHTPLHVGCSSLC